MNKTIIEQYGFKSTLYSNDDIDTVGRIIADFGKGFKVMTNLGEKWLERSQENLAVGDFIVYESHAYNHDEVTFKQMIDRRTKFSRAAAGVEMKEQIVATNMETVFLVQSLNKDFNLKRLERYLIFAYESGAKPVIVLTKSDMCDDIDRYLSAVDSVAFGVTVHAVSSVTGEGIESLKPYFENDGTVALLGSSGVGKSSLVNALLGREYLKTQGIREDDSKGRHTTTHRELVLLNDGGMIMDTPGMRTLLFWEASEGFATHFETIEALKGACRFQDCTHKSEPGCAIRAAIRSGDLDQGEFERYVKLERESRMQDRRRAFKEHIQEKKQIQYRNKNTAKKQRGKVKYEEYQ